MLQAITSPRSLHSTRLRLRPWRRQDQKLFAALNADPEVMEHFPSPLTQKESDALAERIMDDMKRCGWGLWALERKEDGLFLGFTGLQLCNPALPFAPALEVGWRLARKFWGHGYATEAARSALDFAFNHLEEKKVVSFTAANNLRSQAVMRRLNMSRKADFEHPVLPPLHPLRLHVLYAITAQQHAAGRMPQFELQQPED